jgi:squalene-associated FAD-dependent desaturase
VKLAIVGAGWAGMAAAVSATQLGHNATVFEASHAIGGRARALNSSKICMLPDGQSAQLDNGQHILIGAYSATLDLLRQVGIDPDQALLKLPMTLQFPDGLGLRFLNLPTPFDAFFGIVSARGWSLADKWSLLRASLSWQRKHFSCAANLSVSALCRGVSHKVMAELIEPLCVSALNTPPERACAAVFLRVLRDALFTVQGGSQLLLPRTDLSSLFPTAAAHWLKQRGVQIRLAERVTSVHRLGEHWHVQAEPFDAVIIAISASNAALALQQWALEAPQSIASKMHNWSSISQALQHEAIATVYAWGLNARLAQPMLALHSSATAPAQFVFDRGQLGNPNGLLAFVVSAANGTAASLQTQVLMQAKTQLGLELQALQTVVEKRATFACTPGVQRPPLRIAPGLLACGDYVEGPYPATLEGAVRSGLAAVQAL